MKEDVFFSIVAPVYNVEKYLRECVQSVISQEFKSYELILIDDGSTDSSGELCDIYAQKYTNIISVHQTNAGLSEARNTGIRKAKGKYLVFLDSDDMLSKNALSNLYKNIEKYNEPQWMISRRETIINGSQKKTSCKYIFDEDKLSEMSRVDLYKAIQEFDDCWLGAWIFSVDRKFVIEKNLFFYPGILHEDEEWVPRVFFSDGRMGFNNYPLYINRTEREGSITSTVNIKRMFDRLLINNLLEKEFCNNYSADVREAIKQRRCSIIFGLICQFMEYKNQKEFTLLMSEINTKCKLLKESQKWVHRLIYYFVKILGLRNVGNILVLLQAR